MPSIRSAFHLADVLSVLTGVVLSPRGLQGVRALYEHMAGRPVSLVEVQHSGSEYREHILRHFPELDTFVEAEVPFLEFAREWVDRRVREFAEYVPVPPLPIDHYLRQSAPVDAEPGLEETMYYWPRFSAPWIVPPDDDLLLVNRGVVAQPGSRAAARGAAQVERPRPRSATPSDTAAGEASAGLHPEPAPGEGA